MTEVTVADLKAGDELVTKNGSATVVAVWDTSPGGKERRSLSLSNGLVYGNLRLKDKVTLKTN